MDSFMGKPLVSVIIPLHNAELYVDECVQSVLNQSYPNIEIIIVENGSIDKSYEIVQKYESQKIQVLKTEIANASAARNIGIQHSHGDYIQFLDADDTISTTKIQKQIEVLAKTNFDDRILSFCPWQKFGTDTSQIQQELCHGYEPALDVLIDLQFMSSMIAIHSYLISRNLIIKTGMWDEALSSNDDGEWMARILSNAKRLVFVPDVRADYRAKPGSLSDQHTNQSVSSRMDAAIKMCEILRLNSDNKLKEQAMSILLTRELYSSYPYCSAVRKKGEAYIKKHLPSTKIRYPKVYWKSWVYYILAYLGLVKSNLEP